ncbi:MAG: hypothetical protein EP332_06650 [Bacteroidetes bacterium]|nr:MAG: hypothetical protein EP332_06650 [Bacteroidota bacterium]
MSKLRGYLSSCLLLCSLVVGAQGGERYFFHFGPSLTVGNTFVGGVTSVSSPNITGTHHVEPMLSTLWGFPNPQYSFFQNLGRKIHMGFQYERFFNDRHALVTGFELGGRGYIIRSELSSDYVVSYRTISLPLYYSRSLWNGSFWSVRGNIGGHLLYASTIPDVVDAVLVLEKKRTVTPQAFAGIELVHRSFSAPFSFEFAYTHGRKNLIKHSYLALDYVTPVAIQSNGSALHFTVKYLLHEKRYPSKAVDLTGYVQTRYDELVFRNIKEPVKLQVPGDTLEICLSDDQTQDGDSIAIEFNNKLIQKDLLVTAAGTCFKLILEPGKPNTLIVHALNEGKIPPNTCLIKVIYGDKTKDIRLRSDLKNSGAIQFTR